MSTAHLNSHVEGVKKYLGEGDGQLRAVSAERRNTEAILAAVQRKANEIALLLGGLVGQCIPGMDLAAHNAEDLYSLGNNILQAATDGSQNGHAQDAARHVTSALHIVDGTNATCNIPAGIAAADKSVREAISGINSMQAAVSDAERALHTVNHGVVLAAGVNIPGPGLMADGHSQHAVAELVTYQQEILQVN